jgi:hypothetical protein
MKEEAGSSWKAATALFRHDHMTEPSAADRDDGSLGRQGLTLSLLNATYGPHGQGTFPSCMFYF